MKKRSRLLLAGVVLATALSIGALAADEPVKGGIYNISGTAATLTPQTESQGTITPTTDGDKTGYYANAVRMGVEATGLEKGKQYLLLVLSGEGAPTEGNIAYIDQAAAGADGSISFNAYPSALTSGTYRVYIVGGSRAFSAGPAATFQVDQKYELGNVVTGGVNGIDDAININDAMAVIYHIVGKQTLTATQQLAANVVRGGIDEAININDAMQIIYYIVGRIDKF